MPCDVFVDQQQAATGTVHQKFPIRNNLARDFRIGKEGEHIIKACAVFHEYLDDCIPRLRAREQTPKGGIT